MVCLEGIVGFRSFSAYPASRCESSDGRGCPAVPAPISGPTPPFFTLLRLLAVPIPPVGLPAFFASGRRTRSSAVETGGKH